MDSLAWVYTGDVTATDPRPRGTAFSPTGDTLYVGSFNLNNSLCVPVQRFIWETSSGVEPIDNAVVTGYTLSQNYPNPFNPTTEIQFSIGKAGFTTLRVYDILGREVATLVNQEMNAGTFKTTFDASRLTSGTYLYELRSGDTRLVNKMMLVK